MRMATGYSQNSIIFDVVGVATVDAVTAPTKEELWTTKKKKVTGQNVPCVVE